MQSPRDERQVVIAAMPAARPLRMLPNPKGAGVFVFDPATRVAGVERYLLWLVLDGQGYALNGASKTLTPTLRWPREAPPAIWKSTGLNPYLATEAIAIVFPPEQP